jgi:hypothetical protein
MLILDLLILSNCELISIIVYGKIRRRDDTRIN